MQNNRLLYVASRLTFINIDVSRSFKLLSLVQFLIYHSSFGFSEVYLSSLATHLTTTVG